MDSTIIGIGVILLIVGFRWGYMRWKRLRFGVALQRGVSAMQANDAAEAEGAFRECVHYAPTAAQVRLALSAALISARKFDEAEEQLRFAAQLEPRQPRGHLELGFFLALCAPDRPEDAVAAFGEAVKCAPKVRESLAKDPRLAELRKYQPFQDLLQTQ